MGVLQKPWWAKHGTVIFAIVLTVVIGAAVLGKHYDATRAVFPLTVVWALALHSLDNRKIVERMETAAEDVRNATAEVQSPRG